jgi:broad specificity phosphatase PhoE
VPDLLLVRHASTVWSGRRYCGRSDLPLDPLGRRAAADLAARLRVSVPAELRIVSSPRRRATETARVIAAGLRTHAIEVDARWAEADFGVAEGLTYDELVGVAPDIAQQLVTGEVAIDWPNGERAAALNERIEDAWADLAGRSTPTLVVSHAGPIRVAVALATGRPAASVPLIEPAAVVRLARSASDGPWRIVEAPGGASRVPLLRFRT